MSNTDHRHTPAEERAIREAALDESIEGTFPASDPLSSIPNPYEHEALHDEDEQADRTIGRARGLPSTRSDQRTLLDAE